MKTPSPAEFSRVSEEYRQKAVEEEAQKGKPTRPVGAVVVATEEPSTATVFDSFFSALEQEVVLPVSWFPEVPENHPIRQLGVYVRLWDGPLWKEFNDVCAFDKEAVESKGFKTNGELLNWWILAVTTVTSAGEMFFKETVGDKLFAALPGLALKLGGPKHTPIVESIIETAIEFNGLKREVANRDAKKPGTTGNSMSSEELSRPEDAPSETQPTPPQKS